MQGFAYSSFLPPTRVAGEPLDGKPVEFYDDFITGGYVQDAALSNESDPAGAKFSTVADTTAWLVTLIDTDTDAGETIVISDDEPGGVLAITTNDADDDAVSIQLNGEAFKVQDGKNIVFEVRLKFDDVDTTDWMVGLSTTDTDLLGGTTEFIGFRCHDATGDIDYLVEDGSTETTADTGKDLEDDTFVTLGFEVRGNERVSLYVDGERVGNVTENIPDGDAVTVSLEIRNASAATSTVEVDYIYSGQAR